MTVSRQKTMSEFTKKKIKEYKKATEQKQNETLDNESAIRQLTMETFRKK